MANLPLRVSPLFVSSVFVGCLLAVSSLPAQTRFLEPARGIDLANYTTIEECSVLLRRLQDSIETSEPTAMGADTFPMTVLQAVTRRPLSAGFVKIARQCAARFSPERSSAEEFEMMVRLFLQADRDAEVQQLVAQRLGKHAPFDGTAQDTARASELDRILPFYLGVRPARYTAALQLVTAELENPAVVNVQRLELLTRAAHFAMLMDDTSKIRYFTDLTLIEYRRLTSQQTVASDTKISASTYQMLGFLTRKEMLDSLRRGMPSYLALRRTDDRFKELQDPAESPSIQRMGDRARPLHGDVWFTPGATAPVSGLVRPSSGKTSLVVFLSPACRVAEEAQGAERKERRKNILIGCFETYAMLKRFVRQFPGIEVTVATQTYGYLWPSNPLEPSVEAEYLREWWLGFHQLPVTLAVSVTPSWRLEDPDRRRIYDAVENGTSYNTGVRSAVLVNRDGIIVERFSELTRIDEQWIAELLAVLERQ